ncbi:TonB-dependent receptor [Elizabethkingia anophelis]|nr:TonB-dependent receptor [Elizabethkingia anophelis]
MLKRLHSFCLFLLLLIFAAGYTFGQKKDTTRIREVEAVDIFKKNSRTVIQPQKLTSDIIEKLNNNSVADALRYFSGVQIKDYGGVGGLKTVDIRSLGAQHVGVFYDGIPIGNAQNGIVDLGKFSLNDLEEITLYNGQKSDIFQPAKDFGSSGTIYLQPKKPVFRDSRTTNLAVRTKSGSIQTFNPSFRLEQKLSNSVSASFSGEYLDTDGIYKFRYYRKYPNGQIAYDTIAKRHDADVKAKRFETSINGDLKNGKWDLRAYAYLSNRGLPGAIVNGRFGDEGQRLKDANYFVQGSWMQKIFPKVQTQLKAKFAYDYNRYIDTLAPQRPKIDNQYIQREFYISSSTLYQINNNWDAAISADFQYNNMAANLYNFSYPKRYTTLLALATNYRWGRLKAQGSLLGTFVQNKVLQNAAPGDENKWTPALFINYQPFSQHEFYLKAFYKQVFRLPTFNEIYYKTLGMSLLKPEFTHQYDFGFTYRKNFSRGIVKNISLNVDGYYNDVTNKITSTFNSNMFIWMNLSLGKVEIIGTDVNLQSELELGQWRIRPLLTYTYQRARDFTDPKKSYYGHQIPYTPWNSGSFALMTEYKSWGLNYSFVYVGERYDSSQNNIQYNYLLPWYTHDLSVQKTFKLNKHQLKASLEVNNLFNQYYDVVLNYPMPGRNFRFILNFTL